MIKIKKYYCLFAAVALYILLLFCVGVSSYVVGLNDGHIGAGKELSAMIYLKAKNPSVYLGESDAWNLVEKYKGETIKPLGFWQFYLFKIRSAMTSGIENYNSAFENGKNPADIFNK